MTGARTIVLIAAAMAAFVWIMGDVSTSASAAGARAPALASTDEAASWVASAAYAAQTDDAANADGDERVHVQLWTLVAAAGAGGVGLLALLVRMAMGWVKSPPPAKEGHH